MVDRIFFCPEFADISVKADRKTRRRRRGTHANAKRYAFHAKAIIYCCVIWLDSKYRWNCATAILEPIH